MPEDASRPAQTVIRTDLGAIFVSLELSRRTSLIASLSLRGTALVASTNNLWWPVSITV